MGEQSAKSQSGEQSTDQTSKSDQNAAETERASGVDREEEFVSYSTGSGVTKVSARYDIDVNKGEAQRLQRLEAEHGSERVSSWVEEGMPVKAMGKPRDMQAFRESNVDAGGDDGADEARTTIPIQPTLEVSSPDDPAEREAEAVAERVMEMDDPATTEEDTDETDREASTSLERSVSIARSATGETVREETASKVERAVQGGGKSLTSDTQSYFETRFGSDFSDVRVHTGSTADEAARSINAKAYTKGSDIAFAKGEYNPDSQSGKKLLAHELTHVEQQETLSKAPSGQTDSAPNISQQGDPATISRGGGLGAAAWATIIGTGATLAGTGVSVAGEVTNSSVTAKFSSKLSNNVITNIRQTKDGEELGSPREIKQYITGDLDTKAHIFEINLDASVWVGSGEKDMGIPFRISYDCIKGAESDEAYYLEWTDIQWTRSKPWEGFNWSGMISFNPNIVNSPAIAETNRAFGLDILMLGEDGEGNKYAGDTFELVPIKDSIVGPDHLETRGDHYGPDQFTYGGKNLKGGQWGT